MAQARGLAVLMLATRVLADVQDADDTNVGMFYTGLWVPDGDPNTFGKHDTWTNQSGASVVFDFIGTEISVFVTRRPVGTYLSNASFSIDGGPPTLWTTSDPVPAISYKNKVYTSPSLPPAQHRITVTNLGEIFWLDYMEYTIASTPPGGNPPPGTTTTSTSDASIESSTDISAPSVSVASVGTPTVGTPASATDARPPSTTSSAPGTQSPSVSGAPAGTAAPTSDTRGSTAAPATDTHTDTQSSSVSAVPAGTAGSASASATSSSSSHTGVIVGVVVGVLGGIALLISAIWWFRLRAQGRQLALAATPYADPSSRMAAYPPREPPMTQRGMLPLLPSGRHAPASDPGGYYNRPALPHPVERAQSEPGGRSSSKHNTFFQAHEAPPRSIPYQGLYAPVSSPSSVSAGDTDIILEAIPEDQIRMSSSTGLASSPSTPEMASARSARSVWLPRALTFSSASQRSVPRATSPPPAAPGPRYFRVLRQSRDGGVRIAGGRLGELGAQPWTPAAYDDALDVRSEASTMPPSYAQFASAVSGE
ncbi:uncharacterized protein TRAVEDRAFT_40785 [Trametes versicolor FP-101664 SS1]|uniref:Uncharacterized protein n=1 Tax=Trametes versicolor (strain FP-101664) TaxID=717944 RepID=R7S8K6_TRAVS|nr:uncharacterized protein TRAVEDRAFT_40785 [Trametes versicolor FP-101664 SS1]EIW52020.1 hypothetical protein TRAVEDRAFT_40785 [Trametes versicolor FP-101664 SS1]